MYEVDGYWPSWWWVSSWWPVWGEFEAAACRTLRVRAESRVMEAAAETRLLVVSGDEVAR